MVSKRQHSLVQVKSWACYVRTMGGHGSKRTWTDWHFKLTFASWGYWGGDTGKRKQGDKQGSAAVLKARESAAVEVGRRGGIEMYWETAQTKAACQWPEGREGGRGTTGNTCFLS